MARKINKAGLDLVKAKEGLRLKPYLDQVGIPTIGYGTTFYEDGKKVSMNDPEITESRASDLLVAHMDSFAASVEKLVKVPLTDNQFAALCSFVYNLGAGSLGGSTLLKKLNAKDYSGAADEFLVWNKAKISGVMTPVNGLTLRRQAERSLFLQSPTGQSSSALPSGPSDEDINVQLADIEKGVL